ncbi:MAG TPA: hypothetical protein VHP12_09910 [Chitinophagaceae bacterium]|nr:hypothetical protein [Chitinophagaceae bacterium]
MKLDYQQIVANYGVKSRDQLNSVFMDEIAYTWVDMYKENGYGLYGEITSQRFHDFSFVFDFTERSLSDDIIASNLPDSRVVGVYGMSHTKVDLGNRKMMRKYLGKSSQAFKHFGEHYDKGHFIAHYSGGPIDINLFPQKREVNRGWSIEGKKYRAMEKYAAANPGTFIFSRPIYKDFSCCPYEIEFGYCDADFSFVVDVFPNK